MTKLTELDHVERRRHGCDGCRKNTCTERFDGYCGHYLWICKDCFEKLVKFGLVTESEGLKNKK